jgi:hypothetical protein
MSPLRLTLVALAIWVLVGCRTVHSTREQTVPVAIWLPVVTLKEHEDGATRATDDAIVKVLREKGLHPVIDDAGVAVGAEEEHIARQVLLLDKRLIDSGVYVLLAVPAGSARQTANGIEVTAAALAPPR